MPDYRLYHLDPYSGHINGAEEIAAADDVAAIHEIRQRQAEYPFELWQGGRKVVHLAARPRETASVPI